MEFRVLGPIEVWDGDVQVEVAAPRQRAILALLLIHAGTVLTPDRILEEIWGDDQPKSGARTVHFHISKLRSALDPGRTKGSVDGPVVTRGGGYELSVENNHIDSNQFEALVRQARATLGSDPAAASVMLDDGLGLWRGDAYVDFAYAPFAGMEITRLNELRLAATEDLLEARVATGRSAEALPMLERLRDEYPLRERVTATLMSALYAVGRQSDALRVFGDLRAQLADELGIEASPALFELEERILLHDPDLRTAPAAQPSHNLPSVPSRFFDRESERTALAEVLRERRVVTVLGPGGIGKTRLALEVAAEVIDRFDDGVWFVDLSNVASADDVVAATAAATSAPSGTDALADLCRHLGHRRTLLVLDACEHVAADVADIGSRLVSAAPDVRLLITSRHRVNMAGEAVWPLGPLDVPTGSDLSAIEASPCAALFADRARAARPDFDVTATNASDVASVCRHLDGIPLALEIAASQVSALSIADVRRRLHDRLGFLDRAVARSPTGRLDTMRAVLDWSYGLLSPAEQLMLRRLAVFRGGFTLEAAEVICSTAPLSPDRVLGHVERLVDTSFVSSGAAPQRRLRLLDTIRDFAADKAAPDEAAPLEAAHAEYYATLAAAESQLLAGKLGEAEWLRRLDADRDNYRAACEYAFAGDDPVLTLRLAAHLGEYLMALGHHGDGRSILAAALERAPAESTPELVEVLAELAMLELWNGQWEVAREFGDRVRRASVEMDDPVAVCRAHRLEATLAWGRGDYRRAAQSELAALELLGDDDQASRAHVAGSAAYTCLVTGDTDRARRLAASFESAIVELGETRLDSLRNEVRAWLAFQDGDAKAALAAWHAAIDIYREFELRANIADALVLAGWAALSLNDHDEARRCAEEAMTEARALPSAFFVARALTLLGWAQIAGGAVDVGIRLVQRGVVDTARFGDRFWLLWNVWNAAAGAAERGLATSGARLLGVVARLTGDIGVAPPRGSVLLVEAASDAIRGELAKSTWQRLRRDGAARSDDEAAQLVGATLSEIRGGT